MEPERDNYALANRLVMYRYCHDVPFRLKRLVIGDLIVHTFTQETGKVKILLYHSVQELGSIGYYLKLAEMMLSE